jgi:hypothetical protein
MEALPREIVRLLRVFEDVFSCYPGTSLDHCQGETNMRCNYDHVDPTVHLV